jgi:hypothetical protein
MAARERTLGRWVRIRLRLLGGGFLAGTVVGLVATAALATYGGSTQFGTRKAFALGALALGFAVLGWAGSILGGRGIENLQGHLDGDSDWTEADSRRAMARIVGFGAGMMVSVGVVEAVL